MHNYRGENHPLDGLLSVSMHRACYLLNMGSIEIGIMAHNEAPTLGTLLSRITSNLDASRICIVSSGSTDGTDKIARSWASKDPRIQLIVEEKRRGKARAINHFLSSIGPQTDAVVLISGDVIPAPGAIERLLAPLENPQVTMTGGRPCPINPVNSWVNRIVHFQWTLLDHIARHRPKLGEMVAFRPPVDLLDPDTVVDEAALEAQLTQQAGELAYVPEAIVHNQGPQTWTDLVAQRERIWIGHRRLLHRTGYRVSTHRIRDMLSPALRFLWRNPSWTAIAVAAALVEIYSRLKGTFRHQLLGELPTVWPILTSAKPPAPTS